MSDVEAALDVTEFFRAVIAAECIFKYSALVLLSLALVSASTPLLRTRLLALLVWAILAVSVFRSFYYVWQIFEALLSKNKYESFTFWHARASGSYAWLYWLTLFSSLIPQLFWIPRFRRRLPIIAIGSASLEPFALERTILVITLVSKLIRVLCGES
jgi:hypothetical protein